MRNIALICIIILSGTISGQNKILNITGMDITQINENQIKVNLKVHSNTLTYYNSYVSEINGNIVTLKACYTVTIGSQISDHNNDFNIDIPFAPGNYMFKAEIYAAGNEGCIYDNQYLKDFASLDFTNPFEGTITLNAADFENKNKSVKLYPNPVENIFNISKLTGTPELKIKINDASGRMILEKNIRTDNSGAYKVDVSQLRSGAYFLTIYDGNNTKISTEKIIKK